MITIGLTGGIGSGKSTAAALIAEKGYKIIDADAISRRMTSEGSPLIDELTAAFGGDILAEDKKLDRKKLAAAAFSGAAGRKALGDIVTARVITEVKKEKAKAAVQGIAVLFVDAPLLFECGVAHICDVVWLITAEDEIRIKRVIKRDGMDRREVEARIRSQMSQEEKMLLSDEVIDNSGSRESLKEQVERLLERYVGL